MGNFYLALPETWISVDIDEEGIDAILNILESTNEDWAENFLSMFSSDALAEYLKFWAMDSQPAGMGYANLVVTYQTMPFAIPIADYCDQLPATYSQLGIELLDARCDLKINGLDSARVSLRLSVGALTVKQSQYIFLKGRKAWSMACSADETQWEKYAPIFDTIGESFQVVE